jgi:hypothetical protein
MSVEVSALVWKSDVGPANKRLVLLALADNANDAGFCHPGLAYLHGKTGVGRSTIIRIMNELETDGIVQRRDRRRSNGSRRSNAYRIDRQALASRSRTVSAAEENDLAALFEEPQVADIVPARDYGSDDVGVGPSDQPADQGEDEEPQVEHMVPERDSVDEERTARSEGVPPRSDAWSRSGTTPVPERDPLNRHKNRHSDRQTSSPAAPPSAEPAPDAPPEPLRHDVDQLCTRLRDRMVGNGCKAPTITKAWRDAARLLLDKDERDLTKALNLLDWTQDDDFWRANIQSMPKFRAQYDQLRLKAVAEHEQKQRQTTRDSQRQQSRTSAASAATSDGFAQYRARLAAEAARERIGVSA